MTTDLTVLVASSIANALLGFVVLLRNPSSPTNRRFALLSLSLIFWTTFNYLADNASSHNLLFTRMTYVGGVAAIFSVLSFIKSFPNGKVLRGSRLFTLHTIFTVIILPIVFFPQFLTSVTKTSEGVELNLSYLYLFFIAYLLYSLSLLVVAIRLQSHAASSSAQKNQVSLISAGIVLYAVFAIISNVALPAVIDNWSSSRFGPLFTLAFVSMIGYSIIKHKLFDIRLILARSFAYVLLLAVLASIFAVSIFAVTTIFFENEGISNELQAIFIFLALVLAVILQPLKRFFDRVTNKFFYRDSYDSAELLNDLNRSLVTTIDLEELLGRSSSIMRKTIKNEFVEFAIRESHEHPLRLIGHQQAHLTDEVVQDMAKMINNISSRVVLSDELPTDKSRLREEMQRANVATVVKLQGRTKSSSQSPGFILLGRKKSGGLYSSQDIAVLEIIADELVIAIQNSLRFEEIQQFNITLRKKIEEATHELRRVNARLRELDKTKDEFISMASHQLRTPLTAVKGYLSMMLEGDTGALKKDQKEFLQRSFDGAQRMVYLISDMLNVSRLQTGKFVIENKPTYLPDVIQGEFDQLTEQAAARGIEMHFEKPKEFPTLNLDETKTRQVVMNFLDNALYYTPKDGKVEVKLEATPETVNYTVNDTGVGVPKALQHHLFSKFYRADNAKKMRPDGTGLGLYMAKKVIVAQGGAIIFKSVEGKGSTFGFSFPRRTAEVKKPSAKSTS